ARRAATARTATVGWGPATAWSSGSPGPSPPSEQAELPTAEPHEVVADEREHRVGRGGELALEVVRVVDGRGAPIDRLRATHRDDVRDLAARPIELARRGDVRR